MEVLVLANSTATAASTTAPHKQSSFSSFLGEQQTLSNQVESQSSLAAAAAAAAVGVSDFQPHLTKLGFEIELLEKGPKTLRGKRCNDMYE